MTSAKNVAYQSYLSRHYLPSETKRSLMLKPCENKQSLMPLLHAAGFNPQAREVETLRCFPRHEFTTTQLMGVGPERKWVCGLK